MLYELVFKEHFLRSISTEALHFRRRRLLL